MEKEIKDNTAWSAKLYLYCIAENFRQEFNFVAFVEANFWLN